MVLPVSGPWYFERIDPFEAHMFAYRQSLHSGRTKYQTVEIVDTFKFGKVLLLDGKPQSAAYDEYIYHESLVHPAMIVHPEPQRVLIIGGGEGATLREVLRHWTVKRAIMVDLDEEVVALCREHLPEWHQGSFTDPRVRLFFQDGKEFLQETRERFHVIILDSTDFSEQGPAISLFTREFFQLARERLDQPGVLVIQAVELSSIEYTKHLLLYRTIGSVFPRVRSYRTYVPSFRADWGFIVASDELDPGELDEDTVDQKLRERIHDGGSPRFYDGQAHRSLFSLSKDLRKILSQEG